MGFNPWAKSKPQPLPLTPDRALAAARGAAVEANMLQEIKELPEDGYALLVLIKPIDGGVQMKSTTWPPNLTKAAEHGIYNYAARFIISAVNLEHD